MTTLDNMVKIVLGADVGNENIQLVTSMNDFIMKNKATIGEHIDTDLYTNTYNVIYKNKKYVIGDYAKNFISKSEGKATESHLIGLLTSLAATIKTNANIYIALGESMNLYKNQAHRLTIKNLFEGTHEINVNGKDYIFNIKEVTVLPEGSGPRILRSSEVKGKTGYVLDIGSSTVNFAEYKGIAVIDGFAMSRGMHNIISNIRSDFAQNNCGDFSDDKIKEFIEDVNILPDQERRDIVVNNIQTQLKLIDSDLSAKNIKIDKLVDLEVIGGSALQLKEYIARHYKNAKLTKDPLWANARAFYKFANSKYNR